MDRSQYAVFPIAVAKEMLSAFRRLQASGLLTRDVGEALIKRVPLQNETPVFFRNDSGEEVPSYACMQVIGTVEDGGQNYVLIDKPADTDATAGEYLFNGHYAVAEDEFGTAQGGRLVRGRKYSGTATAGDNWSPKVAEWTIEAATDGRFVMAGDDDIDTDVARVFLGGGGGSGGETIQYTIDSIDVAGSTSPYNGKNVATVTIEVAPCSMAELIGTSVEVVDWSGCVFDQLEADLIGVWGWASKYVALSLESGVDAGTLTPCHWGADDRCCIALDGA